MGPSLILALAMALATPADPPAGGAEGPVRLGATARVGGLRVVPLRVVEDSRCPTDARCVWAGRLVLRVRVTGGRWSRVLDLIAGVPVRVADGASSLTSAEPGLRVDARPDPRRMRFAFGFQGGL